MLVVRPITPQDYAALYDCAVESGYGFTSLPVDEDLLRLLYRACSGSLCA